MEVMRRVHRERALLFGGGRALVLQLAHPAVAQGVADHSAFPEDALARLRRTLDLSLALVYEPPAAAAATIRRIHGRVRGTVAGAPYRADDPRLLLWVHATLIDSTIVTYERFVRRLPDEVWRRYYEESKGSARLLGLDDAHLPPDLDAFRAYWRSMLAGDDLTATPESRRLVAGVLRPPLPLALRPGTEVTRLVTIALLPPSVRRTFGLRAGAAARAALAATSASSRLVVPVLPSRARTFAAARVYKRHADRP